MSRQPSVIMNIEIEETEMPKKLSEKELKQQAANLKKVAASTKRHMNDAAKAFAETPLDSKVVKDYRLQVSQYIKSVQNHAKVLDKIEAL